MLLVRLGTEKTCSWSTSYSTPCFLHHAIANALRVEESVQRPGGRLARVPCAVETRLTGEGCAPPLCAGQESTCGRGGARVAHDVSKCILDAAWVPRVSLLEVHPIRGFAHLCLASNLRFHYI